MKVSELFVYTNNTTSL